MMSYRKKPMSGKRNCAPVFLLGALVLMTGMSASATTVRRFDLEEMAETAERILLGTCLSARYERESLGICTRTIFRVEERIKGTFDSDTLVLRLPGGCLDGVRCTIPGMPSFEPGEEVVLFLTAEDAEGYPWVVGLSQGKFSVVPEPISRKKIVINTASGLTFPEGRADERSRRGEEPSIVRPVPHGGRDGVDGIVGVRLDAFIARIRDVLAKKGRADFR